MEVVVVAERLGTCMREDTEFRLGPAATVSSFRACGMS
jgi:hypothetical protein